MTMVGLIPARAGSQRIPGKNMRLFAGHPLLTYAIASAIQSAVFSAVYVSSDDAASLQLAEQMGVEPCPRLPEHATAVAPDIWWVTDLLSRRRERAEAFAILRPTSPFRTAATIQRGYQQFSAMADCGDSIRAIAPVKETPYKMWRYDGTHLPIRPLLEGLNADGVPWHSCPTQCCPVIYRQTATLEMAWTRVPERQETIAGRKIGGFLVNAWEAIDLNTLEDWEAAERLAAARPDLLPPIATPCG